MDIYEPHGNQKHIKNTKNKKKGIQRKPANQKERDQVKKEENNKTTKKQLTKYQ